MSNSSGELKLQLSNCSYVTWKVPNFYSLLGKTDELLKSPEFQFDGGTWFLLLQPKSHFPRIHRDVIIFYINIWLLRLDSSVPEQSYTCSIGVKQGSGEEYLFSKDDGSMMVEEEVPIQTEIKFQGQKLFGYKFFIKCSLESERDKRSDTLTLFCRVLFKGKSSSIARSPAEKEHTATQTEIEPPFRGMEIPSGEKVRSDYKKLLKSGTESDLLIVVSGHEFRAHKCILRARSPVFDAMFEHETAEKESGKVVIDDLHPDPFRDFLEYMYTGSVDAFSKENVCGLYTAADKYSVQELKLEAAQYMKHTLCVESFCDVLILALRHQEKELLDCAVNFFKKHLYDILLTVKWQVFLKDNSTAANELLLKAHTPEGNKNK